MKQQNQYEFLFDRLMTLVNFDLVKYSDGWGIEDRDACVGDSNQRYHNATQIVDRLEIYVDDELIGSVREILEHEFDIVVPEHIDRRRLLRAAKEKLNYDYGFLVDMFDMIVNHTHEINLENCKYKAIEEVKEMKKYTLENYKEFCKNALVAPPIEEFEDGSIDEEQWYKDHNIHITVSNHDIEVGYFADNVNEIEFALEEMYEAEYGDGTPTTGNTVGSQYRPAKMIDFIRVYIDIKVLNGRKFNEVLDDVICGFDINYFNVAKNYIKENYKSCCDEYECDFSKFDVIHDLDFSSIDDVIIDTVCTNYEVSYDEAADRSYIIDFSLRNSGEFIGWTWGSDENDIQDVIHQYKVDTFGLIE